MPYKLCAIDLDDTLLDSEHRISERSHAAIRKVVDRGVIVLIASGRMYASTLRYQEQLGLDTPIICYNGAMVRSPTSGETWLHDQIPAELAKVVMDYSECENLQLNYYLNDLLYTKAFTSWLKLYHDRTGSPIEIVPDLYSSMRGATPTKLIIVDSPERTDELLPYFRDLFGTSLYVTKSNDEYLEFMPPNANKGVALAAAAERLGVKQSETIAFGDSWNDIPMLKWAGLSLAVANAKPELKEVADRVIGRNDEDGVAIELEKMFGLNV